MQLRLSFPNHLVNLLAESALTAGQLLELDPEVTSAWREQARRDAARLSARLDGSPLEPTTVAAVDDGTWVRPAGPAPQERAGGWASALRLDVMETQDVAAIEYDNLLRTHDAEAELATTLFDEPLETLRRLHGLVCEGLVEPGFIGRPRRTEQAMHDGAQGMVIYNAPDHESLAGLLDGLQRWLHGDGIEGSAGYPAPVVAAVVHERLLQWQPFEAGNGRVARAAARMVLRARGFDPLGLAVPERQWFADASGYYGEVAATMRRRDDLTTWVERHVEMLSLALTEALVALRPPLVDVPARAAVFGDSLRAGETVTVAEYAQRHGVSRETAWQELRALMIAGAVTREGRSLGRRFRRV